VQGEDDTGSADSAGEDIGHNHPFVLKRMYRPPVCDDLAVKGDYVKIHYTLAREGGKIIDKSYGKAPLEQLLGSDSSPHLSIIEGMCVQEKRKAILPASWLYGAAGNPRLGISAATVLVLHVELVAVERWYTHMGRFFLKLLPVVLVLVVVVVLFSRQANAKTGKKRKEK